MLLPVLLAAFTTAVADSTLFIRVNQVGYLPDAPKVAVACSLTPRAALSFVVRDSAGRVVLGPKRARSSGAFGPCAETQRLDFSALRRAGRYTIEAGGVSSPT